VQYRKSPIGERAPYEKEPLRKSPTYIVKHLYNTFRLDFLFFLLLRVGTYLYACVCEKVCVYVYVYAWLCACLCVCVFMRLHVFVYVLVWREF